MPIAWRGCTTMSSPSASAARGVEHCLDALRAGRVLLHARLLLLPPLLQLHLHLRTRALVLLVPVAEGRPSLLLRLEDTEEVLHAERIDRLGLVELVGGA